MATEERQFTLKTSVAAMSGAIIVLMGLMLKVEELSTSLLFSIFFASISLPALTAMPLFDDYRENNHKIEVVFGAASFFGYGGFVMCIASLICNFSIIFGFIFLLSGAAWFFVLMKYKNKMGE